ncbi:TetR family transcriptional regulator [Sinimarinibacterium flocculans]|uniref:TetR family transcriptional regulator n=1 Tax=Sinimarinibacterium flocculans TaxID=985250 RepID=A0A318E640_9GAMM|nr:TetR family transcriptional regulator [Sinimarinibacterium flocculans]PXV64282.1 TetR family transcriptional regulator [Sinimarinibacterium flocculans]
MARRTKLEAAETRDSLLDAAEQVFLERGYARSTLEAIARRAGATRGAIYWHFRDKADVLDAMVTRGRLPLQELICGIGDSPPEGFLNTLHTLCLDALLELARDRRRQRVYAILLLRLEDGSSSPETQAYVRRSLEDARAHLEQLFDRARAAGEIDPDLEPRTAALSLHAYMLGIYCSWLRAPTSFSLEGQAQAMIKLFFQGISSNNHA